MKIAFIGLGNMGGSMAQNLLKAGQTVLGYDLSEKALQQFAESGGIVCDNPQAAAEQADVVISMLPAAKQLVSFSVPSSLSGNYLGVAIVKMAGTNDMRVGEKNFDF